MDIEASSQKNAGPLSWVKSLPSKFKAGVVARAKSVNKLAKDDPRRVIHSLKVGLALTLVSMFYYVRPLYDSFGEAGMWAVLTVVVVFEFTVGGTLSKGLNRGFATLIAGALGVGAEHFARLFGDKGEPIVLGFLVFLLGSAATFTRFFPKIKQRYDYGVMIFILTFCLVAVSGYRIDELVVLAHQRLSTILIGAAVCMVICLFICPVWAGEDLHKLITSNVDKLGNYLEGFGSEYFEVSDSKKENKSFLVGYKSILTSKTGEDSLANFARWEPGHGKFRLGHPWKQYIKIAGLVRQCAYKIEALNSYIINSNIKLSQEFSRKVQEPCTTLSTECGKALKSLASSMRTMKKPNLANSHLENSKIAVESLKIALKNITIDSTEEQELLSIIPSATIASILMEIFNSVETISEAIRELSNLARFKDVEATVSPEMKGPVLHRGSVNPLLEIVIDVNDNFKMDLPEKKTVEATKCGQGIEVM